MILLPLPLLLPLLLKLYPLRDKLGALSLGDFAAVNVLGNCGTAALRASHQTLRGKPYTDAKADRTNEYQADRSG